ncbi:MAG: tRNA dihydrouridine(20/20a) synthase DusA [Burkholderiales bacterium]|nr:tRNA dihydrouridine(20/20a) synthase DusA [Burkholderiales bacterium]
MPHPDAWRLTTAPMMDWTDRHCRVLFRHLAPHARLYTEMVTTGPLIYGDAQQHRRHLHFTECEHPVALQLGGSEREDLARGAKLGADYGYDEINLNCGCPSERVQRGAFGACLMAEPALVADCVKAMIDAVPAGVPVTVKHRIGLDHDESYAFVRDFVGIVAAAGCGVFIVHARNAVLKGLSPKENREIPPLRYDVLARLRADFPALVFVLNGGITTAQQCVDHLAKPPATAPHGVMLGRAAYHDSYVLAQAEHALFGTPLPSREAIVGHMVDYLEREIAATRDQAFPTRVRDVARHLLGLYSGQVGGKAWRRMLSDARLLNANDPALLRRAMPYQGDYDDHRQPLLDALSG